jgi:NADPH-dependent 2,4-dienoyl-CoA reductase/sulfur reductase-like enzyme
MADYDVVVVGAGNAALAAAVSAREHGAARVIVLEKAPRDLRGGLFHGNDPGGTGLMAGAVFDRIAGASAAGA